MATRRLRAVPDDPHKQGLDWLSTADDAIVACRAQGHRWPKLVPGRIGARGNKGIRAVRLSDGSVELVFPCPDCDTERRLVTLPGGRLDESAMYRYTYPKGYASPKGSDLTRRDAFTEVYRRTREELLSMSEPPPSSHPIPQTRFQPGA